MKTQLIQRTWILLISTMMVFQSPAHGQGAGPTVVLSTSQANDVPGVVFEPIQTVTGEKAYLALAPVLEAEEASVVGQLAESGPEGTVLVAESAQDPAYQSAVRTGKISRLTSYFAKDINSNPLLSSATVPPALRQKINDKLNATTDRCRRAKTGILGALIYSSAMGSIGAFYFSAGIGAGLQIFGTLFLTYGLIAARSHDWDRLLEAPGKAVNGLLSLAFGEGSARRKHVVRVLGIATSTVVVGGLVNSFVFYMGGHLHSFSQVAYFALIANYSIFDSGIIKKAEKGTISEEARDRYFWWQSIIGTVLECMGIAGITQIQGLLGTVSLAGLIYVLIGEERVDGALKKGFNALRSRLQRVRASSKPKDCASLLSGVTALKNSVRSREDLQ